MGYTKPICDCGQELSIYREYVTKVERTIDKNGMPCKKENKTKTMFGDRLTCKECHNEYGILKDEQGRIMRGKKY